MANKYTYYEIKKVFFSVEVFPVPPIPIPIILVIIILWSGLVLDIGERIGIWMEHGLFSLFVKQQSGVGVNVEWKRNCMLIGRPLKWWLFNIHWAGWWLPYLVLVWNKIHAFSMWHFFFLRLFIGREYFIDLACEQWTNIIIIKMPKWEYNIDVDNGHGSRQSSQMLMIL